MKKLLPLAIAIVALTACQMKKQGIPSFDPKWASADYKVLARTNAEECGDYVFIDWAHLFKNEAAAVSGGGSPLDIVAGMMPSAGSTPEAKRALYHALDKVPEATHLLSPRVHVSWDGFALAPFLMFGKRCATVEAHGVKIGERPVPNAQ
ncbi:MAG: hypothetical protein HN348_04310 [Proteobacteria bacterium]|jgi:hypothetical protein|nr:hypothetical protein [Pseudomonadota bacterium]